MASQGQLAVKIKISELPKETRTVKNGWQEFCINAEGQKVCLKVRPRIWHKMQKADAEFSHWTAAIVGKMGYRIKDGFVLLEPVVQVYERKGK